MRVTSIKSENELLDFVKQAAKWFELHPWGRTFTGQGAEDLDTDTLFAVRWGGDDDCVLVLRTSDTFEPVVYGQVMDKPAIGIQEIYSKEYSRVVDKVSDEGDECREGEGCGKKVKIGVDSSQQGYYN